nr:hypothetical protein [Tanacetum cinerariifolium]
MEVYLTYVVCSRNQIVVAAMAGIWYRFNIYRSSATTEGEIGGGPVSAMEGQSQETIDVAVAARSALERLRPLAADCVAAMILLAASCAPPFSSLPDMVFVY